jgi:hypothetical protein
MGAVAPPPPQPFIYSYSQNNDWAPMIDLCAYYLSQHQSTLGPALGGAVSYLHRRIRVTSYLTVIVTENATVYHACSLMSAYGIG